MLLRGMSAVSWLLLTILPFLGQTFETIDGLKIIHTTLENSVAMDHLNTYTFTVSWGETISDITHSALALRGYYIIPQYCLLSYRAAIGSTSDTQGTISFTPIHNQTQIVRMQFEIMLLTSVVQGKLEMFTEYIKPLVLSQQSRATISEEVFLVSSSSFNLSTPTDFYISAFLVDFHVVMQPDKTQEVRVTGIEVVNQTIEVTLFSLHTYANAIHSVNLSILVVNQPAFSPSIVYYNGEFDSYCHECTKTYQINPTTISSSSCIAPLDFFRASSPAFSPKGVMSSFEGSVISFNTYALSWAVFNISCYLQCASGSYFQYVNLVGTCQSCPTQCATCLNSTYCMTCNAANFQQANQCVACQTGCLNCTGLSLCTLCEDTFALVSGTCGNCSSTAGFFVNSLSKCQTCHSSCTQCFGVSNNCSACSTGYHLDASTRTCLPPPNQIIDCLYITHATLQQVNANMTTPNTYTYYVPWASTINNIATGTLALSGFEVGPAFGYLSYHAHLTNRTSSGVSITIVPNKTNSNIVFLQFDILVVTDCASDKISLFSSQYYPSVLNDSSRAADSEHVTIVSPVFDLTVETNYFISVYLEDFIIFVPGSNHQRIGIDSSSLEVHQGNIRFVLYSHVDYANTVNFVTFTILIVRKAAYQHPFYEYMQFYTAECFGPGCNTNTTLNSSTINPSTITTQDCLIAFYNLRTGFVNETPRAVEMTIKSDSIDYRVDHISWAEYNISCYLTCQFGYYYDGDNAGGVCRMCPLECPECINTTTCCQSRHIYLTASDSCMICGTSQYVENNACLTCSTGCKSCTSATSCEQCQSGYHLETSTGLCQKDIEEEKSNPIVGIAIGVSIVVLALTAVTIFLIWLFCSPSGEQFRKKCCVKQEEPSDPEVDPHQSIIYAAKPPTIQQILANDECAVCLHQQLDTISSCGHTFHLECLKQWTSKLMSCPVCRSSQLGPVDVYCTKCMKLQQSLEINQLESNFMKICECGNESSMDMHSKQFTDRKLEISGGLLTSNHPSPAQTTRRR